MTIYYDNMLEDYSQPGPEQYAIQGDYYMPQYSEDQQQQHQDRPGSSNSSTSSSPQNSQGNRARAQSLNMKSPSGRSTAHITQQQKNQKRQRATPEQLIVLEEAFGVNPSPNAKMREQISSQINMTERSVQIWFQNRRAKTKLLHKKGGLDEPDFQQAPYGTRPGLQNRSYTVDQHGETDLFKTSGQRQANGVMMNSARTLISRLNCRSLTIGSWRRVSCTSMDLVCYFARDEPKFTYYINSGVSGFKIEFAIGAIARIELRYFSSNGPKELGRILMTLAEAPVFYMEATSPGGWKQCTDFTENQQATKELTHAIVGPYSQLKTSLTELATVHPEVTTLMSFEDLQPSSSDSMMNTTFEQPLPTQPRREVYAGFDTGFATPDHPRPRMTPTSASTLDIPNQLPRNLHRRTRSRSAPIAVDFSQMIGHHANVGGMPGYTFGQQSMRIDPNYQQFHHGTQSASNATSFDYTDSVVHTPLTAATPNFQEPWFTTSYNNTPLVDEQHSTLTSPMVPQSSQFDVGSSALQGSYVNGFAGPQQHEYMMANHSVPNLHPSSGVADMSHMNQHFMPNGIQASQMSASQLAPPLTFSVPQPLGIDEMDFGDLQSTQLHDASHHTQ